LIAAERDQRPQPGAAPEPARRRRVLLAALALGVAGLAVAFTQLDVSGNWQGVFLLRGTGSAALVLKDDLFLGDGSRLLVGVSFSRFRRLLAGRTVEGRPHLEVDWRDAQGNGLVRNHLGDGTELVTMFSRFTDDEQKTPHGLFVGGALPDVAASTDQEESGMSFRDARGWHHVWCTTNELMLDHDSKKLLFPSYWQYLGGRVIIRDEDRVVIESSHLVHLDAGGTVRMDRYAYFRAGRPFFKLGVRLSNAGDVPVRLAYGYGDEPWVGHYGSAAGNVGWIRDRLVRVEGPVEDKAARWAGIVDQESGIAAFLAWSQDSIPDRIYFANEAGSTFKRLGEPLDSNEVFVGTEWLQIGLRPGEARSVLLSVGMARGQPGGIPVIPEGGVP
jgi:hypothetical protein